jgi:hypothetical protein
MGSMDESRRLFAVIHSRGPAWHDSRRLEDQVDWTAHARFMEGLVADKFVVLGGPLESTPDVLLIVRATDAAEIAKRLAADPWADNGLLIVKQIYAWQLRLGSLA